MRLDTLQLYVTTLIKVSPVNREKKTSNNTGHFNDRLDFRSRNIIIII